MPDRVRGPSRWPRLSWRMNASSALCLRWLKGGRRPAATVHPCAGEGLRRLAFNARGTRPDPRRVSCAAFDLTRACQRRTRCVRTILVVFASPGRCSVAMDSRRGGQRPHLRWAGRRSGLAFASGSRRTASVQFGSGPCSPSGARPRHVDATHRRIIDRWVPRRGCPGGRVLGASGCLPARPRREHSRPVLTALLGRGEPAASFSASPSSAGCGCGRRPCAPAGKRAGLEPAIPLARGR